MAGTAGQFGIPEIPETKGALGLTGSYVCALSSLIPRGQVDASTLASEGKLLQVGETIAGIVMFIDIGRFTSRSAELAPRQTAFLVNKFFKTMWPLCEAACATFDKTIGDCVMLVLSDTLGCSAPRETSISLALRILDFDPWSFTPHIGFASGNMWLGLNGPPRAMSLSVYGPNVNLAARLLGRSLGNSIVLPTDLWREVEKSVVLPDSFSVQHKTSTRNTSPEGDDFVKDFPDLRYTICARITKWGPVMGGERSFAVEGPTGDD